jgi:CO/xanthine dehydrogenase Mo-binding subunit
LVSGSLQIDKSRLRRVLETVRDRSGWASPMPPGRGRGVACEVFDGDTHVAYVAEVSVEASGKIRIDRLVAVVDAGLVVDPSGAEQQVESGVVWSLSSLFGGAIEFREGRAATVSFGEVPILRCSGMPPVEIRFVDAGLDRPFGLGEPTVSAVIPAVLNAVSAASGRRLRKLPVANGA